MPPVFKIQGIIYHRIDGLLSPKESEAKFMSIYLLDSEKETSSTLLQNVNFKAASDAAVEAVKKMLKS